jgi:hypothetical protein
VAEAINFVLSLLRTGRLAPDDLWVQHHGMVEQQQQQQL